MKSGINMQISSSALKSVTVQKKTQVPKKRVTGTGQPACALYTRRCSKFGEMSSGEGMGKRSEKGKLLHEREWPLSHNYSIMLTEG